MYWEEIIIVGKNQIQTFLGCWVQTPDVPGETYPEYITVFLLGFGSSDKSIIITGGKKSLIRYLLVKGWPHTLGT